jgi:hypothetical protein
MTRNQAENLCYQVEKLLSENARQDRGGQEGAGREGGQRRGTQGGAEGRLCIEAIQGEAEMRLNTGDRSAVYVRDVLPAEARRAGAGGEGVRGVRRREDASTSSGPKANA